MNYPFGLEWWQFALIGSLSILFFCVGLYLGGIRIYKKERVDSDG